MPETANAYLFFLLNLTVFVIIRKGYFTRKYLKCPTSNPTVQFSQNVKTMIASSNTKILNRDIITKLPSSGVLCGNITEFRVEGGHMSQQGEGDPLSPQTI